MESNAQPNGTATLTIDGQTYELPVLKGTIGPDVIDIRSLYKQAGVFTYDPGFTSTGSCESHITYIDGDDGTLLYRGYPIDQLAEHSSFIEVCYLLLHGELPSPAELVKQLEGGAEGAAPAAGPSGSGPAGNGATARRVVGAAAPELAPGPEFDPAEPPPAARRGSR